jgi:hypothetical protein
MKVFVSVVAVLMLLLGSGWLFFPKAMLASWSVQSRAAGASAARAAILGGGAFVTALVTLLSLLGVLTGTIGPGAWGAVVIEAGLTGGFVYYLMAERKQAPDKASS